MVLNLWLASLITCIDVKYCILYCVVYFRLCHSVLSRSMSLMMIHIITKITIRKTVIASLSKNHRRIASNMYRSARERIWNGKESLNCEFIMPLLLLLNFPWTRVSHGIGTIIWTETWLSINWCYICVVPFVMIITSKGDLNE